MIFTVAWRPTAQNKLADIWVQAPDKAAVSRAADKIDADLRVDAHLKGLPYIGPTRIHLEAPLVVVFRVSEPNRIVRILKVWYLPPYKSNGKAQGGFLV